MYTFISSSSNVLTPRSRVRQFGLSDKVETAKITSTTPIMHVPV